MKVLRLQLNQGTKRSADKITWYELQGLSANQNIIIRKAVGYKAMPKILDKNGRLSFEMAEQKRQAQFLLLQWYYTHVIYAEQLPQWKRWIFWHWLKTAWIDDGWIVKNWMGKHIVYYLGT